MVAGWVTVDVTVAADWVTVDVTVAAGWVVVVVTVSVVVLHPPTMSSALNNKHAVMIQIFLNFISLYVNDKDISSRFLIKILIYTKGLSVS